jgi:anti-anti-sigma factor
MSNEHEEKSVALNFLAGMGLGALIGAATALLLAPKPGFETRQDIVNATEDLRSKANRVMNDLSASSDDLVKKSRELLEAKELVVDLTKVDYLDSTALGVLIGGLKRMREVEGNMVLICPSPRIRRVFEITGLDKIFDIYNSQEEAQEAVGKETV